MMSRKLLAVLIGWLAMAAPLMAATITQIEVGNVFGRTDYYQPGSFNYFGVLGAPRYYVLDTGERFEPGAGWIPYTNATGIREQVDQAAGVIRYEFTSISNWAGGNGVLFYHSGQLLSATSQQIYWSEGTLRSASPLVLVAALGSTTASLSGWAQVAVNNAGGGGTGSDSFVRYAAAEGAIVPFHAEFTLLEGATWQPGVFDATFKYTMTGVISFVPEPATGVLMLAGVALLASVVRRRRLSRP